MIRLRRFAVGICGFFFIGLVLQSFYTITTATPVMADITNQPVIVIDPGHGGIDGGAVGVDNIVEKDINLAIGLVLRDIFVVNGFEVIMTRDVDTSIHDEGITGTRDQKISDMHNRLALVESQPNAVFISIHQNKFGDSSSKGAQIFHSPNHPGSETLAEITQRNFVANLQPENHREIKQAGKNLYLMVNAQCPAVLIECGFLSNHDEAYRLVDSEYQSKIAFTVFQSVLQYLEMDTPKIPQFDEQSSGAEGM